MIRTLQIDAQVFRENFNRRPFTVSHGLVDHPLFRLPRLVELARRLPAELVEYNAGDVPVGLDPRLTPRTGLSAEETIRRIRDCRSWLVLKNVEQDLAYKQLLDRCLDELRVHSEPLAPGTRSPEAFVFISSANSVTPFHIDPEHNFLLQVRGRKTIFVLDPADREVLPEQLLESFYSGGHRNLPFVEAWQARANAFLLEPGDGVHVPLTAPHWVRNGNDVSVSFSVTFRSRGSERRARVYAMNARLRRHGIEPKAFGQAAVRDALKDLSLRLIRRSERLWRPRQPTRPADSKYGTV